MVASLKILAFIPLLFTSIVLCEGKEHLKLEEATKQYEVSLLAKRGVRHETNFKGNWELFIPNTGVSVMHSVLLPSNRLVAYDATIWKISQIPLPQGTPCRVVNPVTNEVDCWAHSVEIDVDTGALRPLKLETDTWCSSGGLDVNGTLVGTGGDKGGTRTIRYLPACETCDWKEYPLELAEGRWYSTQVTLADGGFAVFGGRQAFSYELIPAEGRRNFQAIPFPFLYQTNDLNVENNLYPFVHLIPDGNLYVFANNRSVLLDPIKNIVLREYPVLEGGARNYPASGMSVLFPIRLYVVNPAVINAEVFICGGALHTAFEAAEFRKVFFPALRDCARLQVTKPNPTWKKEYMPKPRVMGDMTLLPNGDVLMINGAMRGTSAWNDAADPVMEPVLYKFKAPVRQRFQELAPATVPRMYHSVASLLPDGKIFVGGSNTNDGYLFQNVQYPTELRGEKFSPPYLDPALDIYRPNIHFEVSENKISYNKQFKIVFDLAANVTLDKKEVEVTMIAPAFTTHGISMNHRLLFLGKVELVSLGNNVHQISPMAPPSGAVAPPGYYMLSVVYRGVPARRALWVQIM